MFGFFSIFNKNPLEMPIEKLRDHKIKLDLQIRKVEEEIVDIERQITLLFEEGKKAKTRSEELTIATKIKTLSQRKQNLQATHAQLNKQMMLLSNLMIIKENEEILKSSPLYNVIKKMPIDKLEEVLLRVQLDAKNFEEKLKIAIFHTDQSISVGYEEDEEIKKIIDTMRAVKEGNLEPETAMRKVEKLKDK